MRLVDSCQKFFNEKKLSFQADINFIREDGISLYSNIPDQNQVESIGALACSLWQAGKEMARTGAIVDDCYRLAFDTANSGLYILPVIYENKEYCFCVLYKNVKVPAQLKNEVRKMKDELLLHFEASSRTNSVKSSPKRENFLFSEITDAEIDNLFSVKRV